MPSSGVPLRNALMEREVLLAEVLLHDGSKLPKAKAIFLDYDGTLTPIVNDPERALLSEESRRILRHLSSVFPVGVVSGRSCDKLRAFLQIEEMVLAGSHGLDIRMPPPNERALLHPVGEKARAALQRVQTVLNVELGDIPGYLTEDNLLCVTAHYRMVAPEARARVHEAVERVLQTEPSLFRKEGKMVHELRPAVDWDKGKAVAWLLSAFIESCNLEVGVLVPLYLGDDVADEDAFRFAEGAGGVRLSLSCGTHACLASALAPLLAPRTHVTTATTQYQARWQVGIKVSDVPVTADDTSASWQLTQAQVAPFLASLLESAGAEAPR